MPLITVSHTPPSLARADSSPPSRLIICPLFVCPKQSSSQATAAEGLLALALPSATPVAATPAQPVPLGSFLFAQEAIVAAPDRLHVPTATPAPVLAAPPAPSLQPPSILVPSTKSLMAKHKMYDIVKELLEFSDPLQRRHLKSTIQSLNKKQRQNGRLTECHGRLKELLKRAKLILGPPRLKQAMENVKNKWRQMNLITNPSTELEQLRAQNEQLHAENERLRKRRRVSFDPQPASSSAPSPSSSSAASPNVGEDGEPMVGL